MAGQRRVGDGHGLPGGVAAMLHRRGRSLGLDSRGLRGRDGRSLALAVVHSGHHEREQQQVQRKAGTWAFQGPSFHLRGIISHAMSSPSRSAVVLASVLRLLRPAVRLLLRHGVAYPAFAAALKQVFLDAAREELAASGQKSTDSALSLLSGVHRRDVRELRAAARDAAPREAMNMASQVVARWLSDVAFVDDEGAPLVLPRQSEGPCFDALVAAISTDVRPRAVLDELLRLGLAEEGAQGVRLLVPGFVPRQGFAEMVQLLEDNVHDHLAAACANVDGRQDFLEQAVFVDALTPASAAELHALAARVWRQAFRQVMREAQARFDHDQAHAEPAQRTQRVRFGSYFYAADDHETIR